MLCSGTCAHGHDADVRALAQSSFRRAAQGPARWGLGVQNDRGAGDGAQQGPHASARPRPTRRGAGDGRVHGGPGAGPAGSAGAPPQPATRRCRCCQPHVLPGTRAAPICLPPACTSRLPRHASAIAGTRGGGGAPGAGGGGVAGPAAGRAAAGAALHLLLAAHRHVGGAEGGGGGGGTRARGVTRCRPPRASPFAPTYRTHVPPPPRSILPAVSQVDSTLHFNPSLEYLADRVRSPGGVGAPVCRMGWGLAGVAVAGRTQLVQGTDATCQC